MKKAEQLLTGLAIFLIPLSGYTQPAGYTFGKQITIQASQVSGLSALADFPVLISFTDPDLRTTANGGNVRSANGYDIIFTSNCLTQLHHQIERYNATTGEYVAWVRAPSLSPVTNTIVYMYYGNPSVVANPSVSTVWDANYVGVYHLSNNVFTDATATGNNGVNNSSTNVASAKIAGARSFATNGSYVRIPTNNWSTASGTISLWGYANNFAGRHQYFLGHTTQPPYENRMQIYTDDTNGNLDVGMGQSHTSATNIQDLNTAQWYYITLTWSGGNFNVYVNGNLLDSDTYTNLNALHSFAHIGKQGNEGSPPAPDESIDGSIDEVRVSNTVRSADWILTEYRNQNNPSSFYSVSAQMTAGQICALPVELISFEVMAINGKVKVHWSTASESDNDFFEVERSMSGIEFEVIEKMEGAGNSKKVLNYTTWDDDPYPGVSYYRLKQTDFDGAFSYSKVKSVIIQQDVPFRIYPIPVTDEITIEVTTDGRVAAHLLNGLGQTVGIGTIVNRTIILPVGNLPNGLYYVKVDVGRTVYTRKLVKE